MKTNIKTVIAALLFLTIVSSCKKANISPANISSDPIPFTTLLLKQEVPDTIGLIDLTGNRLHSIRDAIMLDDGTLLAIIGYALYHYNNGEYTLVLDDAPYGVYAIEQMQDGKILVLGRNDALFISHDNGVTFSKQSTFLKNLGQDVALSLYYNGKANYMLARKLSDGSYTLWLSTKYQYHLGGTGFTQDRYMHFVFSSTDGTNWTLQHNVLEGIPYYPTAIDNNGTVYITEEITDGMTFQISYAYHISNDYGKNLTQINQEDVPAGANLVSDNNEYYTVGRIAADASVSEESSLQKWNGKNWQSLNPQLDDKFKASLFNNDFISERAHFTPNNIMLLISNQGILLASRSF